MSDIPRYIVPATSMAYVDHSRPVAPHERIVVLDSDHDAAVAAARDDLASKRLLAIIFHSPDTGPKAFALVREHDVSGVSGTGTVAYGVEFPDGTVALRWVGGNPTSVVFHDNGMESVEAIHGHGGHTRIMWLSEDLGERAAEMDECEQRGREQGQRDERREGAKAIALCTAWSYDEVTRLLEALATIKGDSDE